MLLVALIGARSALGCARLVDVVAAVGGGVGAGAALAAIFRQR
jgi:hypothetical protein